MSYRTLKVVKISDQRLAYVHKTLMASILVYSAISMVGSHTYMLKEKPRMYVATTVDDSLRLSNFTLATAAYCDVADADFAGDTFVAEGAYLDNQCAEHFATSQLTRLTDAGAFVGTHVQTQDWTRACDDDATLTGCVLNDDGDAKNYFPADVDAIARRLRLAASSSRAAVASNTRVDGRRVLPDPPIARASPRPPSKSRTVRPRRSRRALAVSRARRVAMRLRASSRSASSGVHDSRARVLLRGARARASIASRRSRSLSRFLAVRASLARASSARRRLRRRRRFPRDSSDTPRVYIPQIPHSVRSILPYCRRNDGHSMYTHPVTDPHTRPTAPPGDVGARARRHTTPRARRARSTRAPRRAPSRSPRARDRRRRASTTPRGERGRDATR